MPSVLFVCTANVCRSPMAAAIIKQKLQQRPDAAVWRVESAGTWAAEGMPAAEKAQAVLKERGIDLSTHYSRQVNRALLRPFDLIVVMEQGHKEAIRAEFPELAGRVHLLSEMAGIVYNIGDPIGGSMADFVDTARELDEMLTQGFDQLIRLAQGQKSQG